MIKISPISRISFADFWLICILDDHEDSQEEYIATIEILLYPAFPAACSIEDHHAVHTDDSGQASHLVMGNNSNVHYDA